MDIIKKKIKDLKPADYNPRKINDADFEQLKKSLEKFEAVEPAIINSFEGRENIIVGGHQRIKAAKSLGWKEFPCVMVNLDLEQEKELNVRLNKNTGEFDFDVLKEEFQKDELLEFGFSDDELFMFDEVEITEGLTDEDSVPEIPEEPKTKEGDIYILGNHRLMCGDSTSIDAVEKLMDGEKADMLFTDPPYNINFKGTLSCTSKEGEIITQKEGYKPANSIYDDIKNDSMSEGEFYDFISSIISIIKLKCIGGWYICFSSSTLQELLNPLVDLDMKWKSIIIFNKNQSPMGGGHFRKKYEPIVYGYNENNFYGNEYAEDDVWDIQRTLKNDLHPTMKPIELVAKSVEYSSKAGMKVLDLFGGSGSTMIACEKTGRKARLMELDPKYCDVIVKRWEDFTGKKAELLNG